MSSNEQAASNHTQGVLLLSASMEATLIRPVQTQQNRVKTEFFSGLTASFEFLLLAAAF